MSKRTLKYWGLTAEKMVFFAVAMSIVFVLFQLLMMSDDGVLEVMSRMPAFMLIFATITLLTVQVSHITTTASLTISLGATRRETFYGMHWMNLLTVVQLAIVFDLAARFCAGGTLWRFGDLRLLGLAILLIGAALGQLGAWLKQAFGKAGQIFMVITVMLVSGFCGFCASGAIHFAEDTGIAYAVIGKEVVLTAVILMAAAAAVYAIAAIQLHRQLMKYEVQ